MARWSKASARGSRANRCDGWLSRANRYCDERADQRNRRFTTERAMHRGCSSSDAYRTVAGSGGTTVGAAPGTPCAPGTLCGARDGPALGPGIGAAEAVVVDGGGAPPGSTTTRVPTLTRSNRSETSSFSIPMQPDETNLPIVEGWLVPWMR